MDKIVRKIMFPGIVVVLLITALAVGYAWFGIGNLADFHTLGLDLVVTIIGVVFGLRAWNIWGIPRVYTTLSLLGMIVYFINMSLFLVLLMLCPLALAHAILISGLFSFGVMLGVYSGKLVTDQDAPAKKA